MPHQPEWHLTPHEGGWQVKRAGAERAAVVVDSKAQAIEAGRGIAKNGQGQLIVHDHHGVIQWEWTYGPDPRKTKG